MNPSLLFNTDSINQKSSKISSLFSEDKTNPIPNSITELFTSAIPNPNPSEEIKPILTREQILSKYSKNDDISKIEKAARELFMFSETTLPPEAVLHPDLKPKLYQNIKEKTGIIQQHILPIFNSKLNQRKLSEQPKPKEDFKSIDILFSDTHEKPVISGQKITVDELFSVTQKPKSERNLFFEYSKANNENDKIWYYKDLKGDIQGPFTSFEMNEWNKGGFLFENLMVNVKDMKNFRALKDVLKDAENSKIEHVEIKEIFQQEAKPVKDSAIQEIVENTKENIQNANNNNKFSVFF